MKAEQGDAAAAIPKPAAATPVLPWLVEYWRAWWTLHPDRPKSGGGMGPAEPGPIPWRDLVLWCDVNPHLDFDLLTATSAAMDRVYLAHWAAETKKAADKARREADARRRRGRT